MMQPEARHSRRRTGVALGIILGAVALAACRGENLFSLAATSGELGPQVVMTAPSEGFTISIGDSILVTADITSSGGIATVDFRGNYAGASDPAFVAESQTGGGVEFLSVTNRLQAAVGQVAGEAYVVVQATDLSGGIGVDSVKVTIN